MSETIDTLAGFLASTGWEAIPASVKARARWILTDCAGCIVAGNRSAELRALADITKSRPGLGEAQVLGTRLRLPREAASGLNAAAGTWLDLDEGNLHTKGHAGIQIVPALLAEAEAEGASGREVLRALILSYEVGCRVYGATAARLAVHPHGTYGPMAAAAALACLRGLDQPAIAQVLRLAAGLGVPASRRTLTDGATLRNAFTAASARAAFHAHDLAAAGFTGEQDPLASVFGTIYGTGFDAAACVAGLGQEWKILGNYFKLHPSGRYAHSALDLIDDVAARHGPIAVERIEDVTFHTYFMATTMGDPRVTTPFGTRFSLPFAVAARLLGAETGLDGDAAALFARRDVHALAQRVRVIEDQAASAAYPARQATRLRLTLTDGAVLHAAADYIRGEAELPHTDAALEAKFLTLTEPSWGEAAAEACAALRDIDRIERLAPLFTRLRQAGRSPP